MNPSKHRSAWVLLLILFASGITLLLTLSRREARHARQHPANDVPRSQTAATPAAAKGKTATGFDRREAQTGSDREKKQQALREERQRAAERLKGMVRAVQVDFDARIGSPRFISSNVEFLTVAGGRGGAVPDVRAAEYANDEHGVVKAFIAEHAALFGHDPQVLADARVARDYVTAHNGLRTTVWQQELDGVRVFESTLQAHVTKDGALVNVASMLVPDARAAAEAGNPGHWQVMAQPPVDAPHAISAAAATVGDTVPPERVMETAQAEGVSRRQAFRAPALLDLAAEYVWLPQDEGLMRLCWEVTFVSRKRGEMFRTLVDATTGVAVVQQRLTEYISPASYRVFTSDSPTPMSPGLATPLTTQPAQVARQLITIDALDTTASPNGWIEDGVTETRGNNVDAHLDLNSDDVADTPRPQSTGAGRVFDPPLDLTQPPSANRDAAVVNLFYWNNVIHDRYYQLGFTEAAGNFQLSNFGRGGAGNDAVQADAQDGSGTDNANFSTPPDGSPGRMQMYVFTGPTPDRDGDFDQEIVIHEYTHGLSNRLVGGGVGISALQPRGMGEGWSDFYALCLLSQSGDDPNGTYAAGAYASYQLSGLTSNYYYGIRRYPYCTDLLKNPLTFKDIDPSQASAHSGVPVSPLYGVSNGDPSEVHGQGEVWCVALWDVRANLIAMHGSTAGNDLAMRLVTDGMKLAPANPNFLQARDAILQADAVFTGGANRGELWTAFAKRGMGANATSPSSATSTGVVENYDIPDNLGVTPSTVATSTGTIGGPFTPAAHSFLLVNSGAAPLNWTAADNQPWLDLSATSGTLAAGANTTVIATLNASANSLTSGTYTATLTFTNTTSGLAQQRSVSLTAEPFMEAVFAENFEGATLGPQWTVTGTGPHRTLLTTANLPHGGAQHLTMDSSLDSNYARNEATLTLDLAGRQNLTLRFWAKMFSDEPDGPPPSPFPSTGADFDGVAISADGGANWHEVQPLRSLGAAWQQLTVDLDAALAAHGLSYTSNFKIRFNHYDNFTIPTDGFAFDDILVARIYNNSLALTLPAALDENAAPATATITANPAPASNLTVALSSSLPAGLGVPASVIIPAGQASVTFPVTPVNDTLLNGTRTVTITATAATFANASGTVALQDDETAVISLSLPATTIEGAPDLSGTVTLSAVAGAAVRVSLASSDTGELVPPAFVTVPAGQSSATFPVAVVDDTRIDGTRNVTITASVANWTSGSATVTVQDNETTALSVAIPATAREGDTPRTGTVSINGTLSVPLTIPLASDDTSEATVPASVTIPAGQTSANFAITIVDDALSDGAQTVTISASAAGFTGGSGTMIVADNDAHHFVITPIAGPVLRNAAVSITITAKDVGNATITNFDQPVNFTAADGASASVPVTPASTIGFVNGVKTGDVAFGAFGTGVVLTVADAGGHSGVSNAFNVTAGALHHFAWDTIASPQSVDAPFAVTLRAADIVGNAVPTYTGTAALSSPLAINVEILTWTAFADTTATGEYVNTKAAISTFFTNYHETATTTTDATTLAGLLAGKNVFLIVEQETSDSATLGSIGTAWTGVLNTFVNGGGTIIVCSYSTSEHLLLTNSGLLNLTPVSFPNSAMVTKPADTPLNANVATPFTGEYLHTYATTNGTVSLQTSATEAVVISRDVGAGRVVLVGTDFYTIGTGMDRVIANAVALSAPTGASALPVNPATTGAFTAGVWTGAVSLPYTSASVKLRATSGAITGDSNAFAVTSATAPSGTATVFAEDFESGILNPAYWTVTGTGGFHMIDSNLNGPHGGLRHMTMDEATGSGSYARNEATLTLNLAGRTGVVLTFWAKMFDDDPHGPPTAPFTGGADFDGVAMSADGTTWWEVQSLRSPTITNNWAQFSVDLDAAIAARAIAYNGTFKIRFNQYDNYSIATDGIAIDDILVAASAPASALTLVLPAQANEGGGVISGSVTIPAALGSNLVVSLTSKSAAKVTVPATLTIPAGQTSATFPLTVLDDPYVDGPKNVVITAVAAGYLETGAAIQIVDNDGGALSLSVPVSVAENAVGVTGALTLSVAPLTALTVSLSSSDTTAAQVPASVTVQPGRTTATFPITPVNDTIIDGTQTATITASLAGWTGANATLQVTDDESRSLALTTPVSVTEGTTGTGTVSISGTVTTALLVNLSSSNTAQLTVPASVTIPAGSTSAIFVVTGVDDTLADGSQAVTITASAATFTSATANTTVLDNELHHFGFSTIAAAQSVNVPFSVTITAQDLNGVTIPTFAGTATLGATGTGGPFTASPSATTAFTNGVWTGNVAVAQAGTNVRLTATNGAVTSNSGVFALTVPPTISATPASFTISLPQNSTTTAVLTLGNAGTGNLTWSIATAASVRGKIITGPEFKGAAQVAGDKSTAPRSTPDQIHAVQRTASEAPPSLAPPALAAVLANLNINSGLVRALIPGRYAFTEGAIGNNIGDGGNDMYDGGNFLGTSIGSFLPYSDNLITANAFLGTGGQYFTRKYDGLFVFAADVNGLGHFEITGDLGADGTGATDSSVITVVRDGTTYRGFVKRVYSAGDPSVNHIIIVPDNGTVTHTVTTNTNDDFHRVTSLTGVTRIYHVLYAGTGGSYIDNTATQAIMTAFLDAVATPDWVAPNPASGTIAGGATQNVTLTISTAGLTPGSYTRTLIVSSNDPLKPQVSVPINLTVVNAPAITVTPATGWAPAGSRGGPFSPVSQTYVLSNPGNGPVAWTATKAAPWFNLSATGGTIAVGGSVNVTASLNTAAYSLASGSFANTITFTNATNGIGNTTRSVSLTVTPHGNLTVSGSGGGYTLGNSGDAPLDWTLTNLPPWLGASSTGGTLAVGGSATATIFPDALAALLALGHYEITLTFKNITTGHGTANVTFTHDVLPPAPAIQPEPPFTGGTSNTIAWLPAANAGAYEVERAANPAFSGAQSSGWIAGLAHTFAGLAEGQPYHYRTRARIPLETLNSWSQTTAADLTAGTPNNVVADSTGIVLAITGGGPIAGRIQNPSFEIGTLGITGGTTSWTTATTPQMGAYEYDHPTATPLPTDGSRYEILYTFFQTTHAVGDSSQVSQIVDLTGATALLFDARLVSSGVWSGSVRAEVRIDGVPVWNSTTLGIQLNQSVDVSGYSGVHTIDLREVVIVPGTFDSQWVCFDNLRLNGLGGSAAAGTLVSPTITARPVHWGQLIFSVDTPAGTTLTVDVLDAANAALATNLASGADLGSLAALGGRTDLRLRANLATTNPAVTPRLRNWAVTWAANAAAPMPGAWSATVTSTQDATPPTIARNLPGSSAAAIVTPSGGAADALSGVTSVSVNGSAATSADGFATWTAPPILLAQGNNSLTVVTSDGAVPPNVRTEQWQIIYTGPPTFDADGDGLPDAWEKQRGLNPADPSGASGPSGDPDHNGISNLVEYALNLSAGASGISGLPVTKRTFSWLDGKEYLEFTYRRRIGATGLTYTILTSSDATAWSADPANFEQLGIALPTGDGVTEAATFRILPAIGIPGVVSRYVRLRVSSP